MEIRQKPKGLVVKSLLALAGFAVFYLAATAFLPVLLAIGMSFLLYPIVDKLEKLKIEGRAFPNTLAVLISFLIFGLFVVAAVNVLIVPLVTQVNNLLKALPGLAVHANESLGLFLGGEAQKLPPNVREMLQQGTRSMNTYVMGFLKAMVASTVQAARSLVNLALVPFLSFYFLKDWRTLKKMVVGLFSYNKQALADQVLTDMGHMLCAYVDNMFKLCFVSAFILTIGNTILGVQYTYVLGFLAMISEMIPMVGSVAGTLAAVFIAFLQQPSLAVKVLVLYLVYYQVDAQVIMPNLMGHGMTLHPVLIILAVIIDRQLGGVAGLIFAVPVLTSLKVLYGYFWHAGEEKAPTQVRNG